jgi:hypothetical protein
MIRSDSPPPYTSAVSTRCRRLERTVELLVRAGSAVSAPKVIVPSARVETAQPLRPRVR